VAILTIEDFDEVGYLLTNPDVADAVRDGVCADGWEHYQRHGRAERRSTRRPVETRVEKILASVDTSGLGLEVGLTGPP